MKAIILAAGFATRLYPITIDKAKPLLAIQGRPIIDYIVDKIDEIEDIDKIIVVSNNRFHKDFTDWRNDRQNFNITILNDGVNCESEKKGSIGDLMFALDKEAINEDLLVISGDNLFKCSLKDAYDIFRRERKDLSIFYDTKDSEEAKRLGVALVKNNLLVDFEEKPKAPKSTLCSASTYFYKQSTLPMIKEFYDNSGNRDYPGLLVQYLYNRIPIYVHIVDEWIDIGTHESLRKAQDSF
jgi:glucose-1-phosphate thymidylyltransferase